MLNNNITRRTDGLSQLGTGCWSESQWQTEGFGPSVTQFSNPAKMRKKYCWVNIAVCPCLQLISHTQPTSTLSRIKCERYIFIKNCVHSFTEVRILCLIMFLHIFVYVCGYTTLPARLYKRSLPPMSAK